MIKVFVLIMTLTYNGAAIHTHEFADIDACKNAGDAWVKNNPNFGVRYVCVEKKL
jgi:hypothetical protein